MNDATVFLLFSIAVIFCILMAMRSVDKRKESSEDFLKRLQELPNFKPQKTIIKYHIRTLPTGISLDNDEKKICLIGKDELIVKPFSDIIEAQVVVDGKTVTKTSRGSQAVGMAVGAALGGGLGMLIGGLSGSTSTSTKIKTVSIKLLINDLNTPTHEVNLIGVTATGALTPLNIALKEAEEWDNILKVVLFQAKEERANPTANKESQTV